MEQTVEFEPIPYVVLGAVTLEQAADTLGGERNGGQRVLDLVSHPLGHLLPGGRFLRS